MKKIVLTGGGTAGHVTPNIALLPSLKEKGYEIEYIGSSEGIEKTLITEQGIEYHSVATGKLRRYFSLKNFTDPFRVIKGFFDALGHIGKIKPSIVFSKGGFVSVPVVIAAAVKGVPVIIHESDMTPGLANKICLPFAKKVCCNFPETVNHLPKGKGVQTGSPIREELFTGDASLAESFLYKQENTKELPDKPYIMVMGGSLGAVKVNEAVRKILPQLLEKFNVIHLCGKGKLDKKLVGTTGYFQFEYIKNELKDLFALSDIIVTRAGANAICEILALAKPNLLIPLSAKASRGDQILNAKSFVKQGFSLMLDEDEMTSDDLYNEIIKLYENRDTFINTMKESAMNEAIEKIVNLIVENSK